MVGVPINEKLNALTSKISPARQMFPASTSIHGIHRCSVRCNRLNACRHGNCVVFDASSGNTELSAHTTGPCGRAEACSHGAGSLLSLRVLPCLVCDPTAPSAVEGTRLHPRSTRSLPRTPTAVGYQLANLDLQAEHAVMLPLFLALWERCLSYCGSVPGIFLSLVGNWYMRRLGRPALARGSRKARA